MTDLTRRIAKIEGKVGTRDPVIRDMPGVLIHENPKEARLRDDVAKAIERDGRTIIILPPGRSVMHHTEPEYEPARREAIAFIARCHRYFKRAFPTHRHREASRR